MNADKLIFLGLLALGAVLIVAGLMFRDPVWGLVLIGAGGLVVVGTIMRTGRSAHRHRRDRQSEIYANAAQRGDTAFFSNPTDGPVL